jgi:hypothetical protein
MRPLDSKLDFEADVAAAIGAANLRRRLSHREGVTIGEAGGGGVERGGHPTMSPLQRPCQLKFSVWLG